MNFLHGRHPEIGMKTELVVEPACAALLRAHAAEIGSHQPRISHESDEHYKLTRVGEGRRRSEDRASIRSRSSPRRVHPSADTITITSTSTRGNHSHFGLERWTLSVCFCPTIRSP